MKMKILCVLILAMFGLTATAADEKMAGKKYRISIHKALRVGTSELQPGEYHLVLGSPKVRFMPLASGEAIEVEATVHSVEQKFSDTLITSSRIEGREKLREIALGGTRTKVAFP
ncbi:MAG TPA: hypothetical protein VLY04_20905 [Bryobacteraceae bacterium]|nr:hypothetical protein [Bryobacteraceae bacterium]